MNNSKKLTLGNNGDLEIFHNGTNGVITNNTGDFFIENSSSATSADILHIRAKAGENSINANVGGSVELFHNTNKKFETTNAGIEVQGEGRFVNGDVIAFAASDRNLKDNITPIPNALDKVNSLSGNTFTWKPSGTNQEYFLGQQDTGVIAQEVEALGLPGITTTRDDGTKAVRYERLIPVLIQAVKELSAKVSALEGS